MRKLFAKMRRVLLLSALLLILPLTSWGFVVVLDVGHSSRDPGVISAYGFKEYSYNYRFALILGKYLKDKGVDVLIIEDAPRLKDRVDFINKVNPDLLLSIHHDSVQPRYLQSWKVGGKDRKYSDKFKGHSIFISRKNSSFEESYHFAFMLGETLYNTGYRPTLHHAEKIEGEGKPLVDDRLGIYFYDNLYVLRHSKVPAVLLEVGVIVNRQEEELLTDPEYVAAKAKVVAGAVSRFATKSNSKALLHLERRVAHEGNESRYICSGLPYSSSGS
jgi:N-acetylmuramoyl-L-alanine amidase